MIKIKVFITLTLCCFIFAGCENTVSSQNENIETSEKTQEEQDDNTKQAGDSIDFDSIFDDFLSGNVPATKKDSNSDFYITELNYNSDDWDSYRLGEKIDLDNDGELELILDGPYGGMYLDVMDGKVYVLAEGDGTGAVLSYVYYSDAYWIVKSDTTHSGRVMYSFIKYSGGEEKTDSFELSAEYEGQDKYDENSKFIYRGEEISMEQYEQIYAEIF